MQASPIPADHPLAYDLNYSHCERPDTQYKRDGRYVVRSCRVVMLRHSFDYRIRNDIESFSVVECDTGDFLGSGDTKSDANSEAQYRLMDRSRSMARSFPQ